jgi:hypothetical protein
MDDAGQRIWGFSSSGRAPALQAGGERFDPVNLHQDRHESANLSQGTLHEQEMLGDSGLIISINKVVSFFNNLEEVK